MVDDQTGAPTWCRSIAEATLQILKSWYADGASTPDAQRTGIYHLSCGGQTTWYGFTNAILEGAKPAKPPRVLPIATSEYPTPAVRPPYSVLNNEKLERAFGVRLPSWQTRWTGVSNRGFPKGSDGGACGGSSDGQPEGLEAAFVLLSDEGRVVIQPQGVPAFARNGLPERFLFHQALHEPRRLIHVRLRPHLTGCERVFPFAHRHQFVIHQTGIAVVHEIGVAGVIGRHHRFSQQHALGHAETDAFRAMQETKLSQWRIRPSMPSRAGIDRCV